MTAAGVLLMEGECGFALVPRTMLASAAVRSLSPSGLRAWLALLSHASHEHPQPFPSWARLQRVAGLSRSQLARGLASLRAAGLLTVQRRGSMSARYTLRRPVADREVSESDTSQVSEHDTSEVSSDDTQKRPGKRPPKRTPQPPGAGGGGAAPEAPPPSDRSARKRARSPAGRGGADERSRPSLRARLLTWAGEEVAASTQSDDARHHYPGGLTAYVDDVAADLVDRWQREPEGRPLALVTRDERLARQRDRLARLEAVREAVEALDPSAVAAEALGLLP